jgi:hypothetical protein
MTANSAMFAVIAQAEDSAQQNRMLGDLAKVRKVNVEVLKKEFETFTVENEAKIQADAAKAEREALEKEAKGMTVSSDTLGAFIKRVYAAGGSVILNEDLTLGLKLKGGRKGGNGGGGKPAADAPQPYLDSAGDRVLGPLTDWARANLSESEQKAAGCFRPNGKFRTGASLGKALVKANILTESPVE